MQRARAALQAYRLSLPHERRVLFDRYRLEDIAVKAVGIGSVGTYCFVGLFFSAESQPLLLQFKEACPSVWRLTPARASSKTRGSASITGQRLMQSSSDIFLGWTRGQKGRDFFVRQMRDMKMSAPIEGITPARLKRYAQWCGQTLARAHAKSGDAALISGYLGKSDSFDQAIGKFAVTYADQNAKDYAALLAAYKSGRITALMEEEVTGDWGNYRPCAVSASCSVSTSYENGVAHCRQHIAGEDSQMTRVLRPTSPSTRARSVSGIPMGVGLMNLMPRLPVTQLMRGKLAASRFPRGSDSHDRPVGVAVDQHGDQSAVDQVRPAAVFGIGYVLGHDMHAVLMPVALDVQPVGVAAAAAVANAIRARRRLAGRYRGWTCVDVPKYSNYCL